MLSSRWYSRAMRCWRTAQRREASSSGARCGRGRRYERMPKYGFSYGPWTMGTKGGNAEGGRPAGVVSGVAPESEVSGGGKGGYEGMVGRGTCGQVRSTGARLVASSVAGERGTDAAAGSGDEGGDAGGETGAAAGSGDEGGGAGGAARGGRGLGDGAVRVEPGDAVRVPVAGG
eukprot:5428739-Pleurochrysis_carterae.AAC.1